jgi:hypothetical protein
LASGIAAAVTDSSPGDVAIFVPFPFLESVKSVVGEKVLVGAEVSVFRGEYDQILFLVVHLTQYFSHR